MNATEGAKDRGMSIGESSSASSEPRGLYAPLPGGEEGQGPLPEGLRAPRAAPLWGERLGILRVLLGDEHEVAPLPPGEGGDLLEIPSWRPEGIEGDDRLLRIPEQVGDVIGPPGGVHLDAVAPEPRAPQDGEEAVLLEARVGLDSSLREAKGEAQQDRGAAEGREPPEGCRSLREGRDEGEDERRHREGEMVGLGGGAHSQGEKEGEPCHSEKAGRATPRPLLHDPWPHEDHEKGEGKDVEGVSGNGERPRGDPRGAREVARHGGEHLADRAGRGREASASDHPKVGVPAVVPGEEERGGGQAQGEEEEEERARAGSRGALFHLPEGEEGESREVKGEDGLREDPEEEDEAREGEEGRRPPSERLADEEKAQEIEEDREAVRAEVLEEEERKEGEEEASEEYRLPPSLGEEGEQIEREGEEDRCLEAHRDGVPDEEPEGEVGQDREAPDVGVGAQGEEGRGPRQAQLLARARF